METGPSRAELLTGRYMHNLALDETSEPLPAHDAAENCMHIDGRKVNSTHGTGFSNLGPTASGHGSRSRVTPPAPRYQSSSHHSTDFRIPPTADRSFALALQAAGYRTALFGKYLNRWPTRYTPTGFDAFLGNGGGTYISPHFVAKGMVSEEGFGHSWWPCDPTRACLVLLLTTPDPSSVRNGFATRRLALARAAYPTASGSRRPVPTPPRSSATPLPSGFAGRRGAAHRRGAALRRTTKVLPRWRKRALGLR